MSQTQGRKKNWQALVRDNTETDILKQPGEWINSRIPQGLWVYSRLEEPEKASKG